MQNIYENYVKNKKTGLKGKNAKKTRLVEKKNNAVFIEI